VEAAGVEAVEVRGGLHCGKVVDDVDLEEAVVEPGLGRDVDAAAVVFGVGDDDGKGALLEGLAVDFNSEVRRPVGQEGPRHAPEERNEPAELFRGIVDALGHGATPAEVGHVDEMGHAGRAVGPGQGDAAHVGAEGRVALQVRNCRRPPRQAQRSAEVGARADGQHRHRGVAVDGLGTVEEPVDHFVVRAVAAHADNAVEAVLQRLAREVGRVPRPLGAEQGEPAQGVVELTLKIRPRLARPPRRRPRIHDNRRFLPVRHGRYNTCPARLRPHGHRARAGATPTDLLAEPRRTRVHFGGEECLPRFSCNASNAESGFPSRQIESNLMTGNRLREELYNTVTHGVGALLGVAGLVVLVVFAALEGGAARIVAAAVFGSSLVLLYAASTCYHAFRCPKKKRLLRKLDHAAIYVLIAGTYTPFTLLNLRGGWGWTLFGLVWGIAALGITFKVFYTGRFEIVSTLAYIGMGWLVLIAVKPTLASIDAGGLALLVAGGLAYTLGTVFYALSRVPYNHAIWHLFVLAGSMCHFFAVLHYARP
jgi:hemolysin III